MANDAKKSEGPACACGKEDLFEVWKKMNENKEEVVSDSGNSDHVDDSNRLADNVDKEDQMQAETEK